MTLRAIGAFDGLLPEPTGMIQGFMRDPSKAPYLKYVQMIPAPEIAFMYARLDPDEAVRLTDINDYAWAYDDYRPSGRAYTAKVEWITSSVQRWDFPFQIGDATKRVWSKAGINPKMLYDRLRANHAMLHRAIRCVTALTGAAWAAANTSDLNVLLGTVGAFWDKSSGTQYLPDGTLNPNFQIIRKTLQVIKRRINLSTNNALTGEEMVVVLPPKVAQNLALAGEIVDFLKQSTYAKEIGNMNSNMENWGIPDSYGGFKLVVEDTARCFINTHADGTVADVTQPSNKDYIYNDGSVSFVSRPGGLESGYGFRNFSTIQCYHFGGEARVQAFDEPKHELTEGHIVMEDRVLTPALISGFRLTGVLSATAI